MNFLSHILHTHLQGSPTKDQTRCDFSMISFALLCVWWIFFLETAVKGGGGGVNTTFPMEICPRLLFAVGRKLLLASNPTTSLLPPEK